MDKKFGKYASKNEESAQSLKKVAIRLSQSEHQNQNFFSLNHRNHFLWEEHLTQVDRNVGVAVEG